MTTQRTCINDSNPAEKDSVLCTICLTGGPLPGGPDPLIIDVPGGGHISVPSDLAGKVDFESFAADPFATPKAQPIPDEQQEEFAREMRQLYVALTRQGFNERQALTLISGAVSTMLGIAAENARQDKKGDQ